MLGAGPVGLAVVAELRRIGHRVDRRQRLLAAAARGCARDGRDARGRSRGRSRRWTCGNARTAGARRCVFDAIGVPGTLGEAMRMAPPMSRVCVVGSCMESDTIRPLLPQTKQLTIMFSFAYDPFEFGDTLRAIAEGEIDVTPMITGTCGIDGVPDRVRRARPPRGAREDPRRAGRARRDRAVPSEPRAAARSRQPSKLLLDGLRGAFVDRADRAGHVVGPDSHAHVEERAVAVGSATLIVARWCSSGIGALTIEYEMVRVASSRLFNCSWISMPMVSIVRMSPSTSHVSMPGIHVVESAELADERPHFVGRLRDRHFGLAVRHVVLPVVRPDWTSAVNESAGVWQKAPGAVKRRRCQRSGVKQHRARIALEEPAGEAAAGPVRPVGGLDRRARAAR